MESLLSCPSPGIRIQCLGWEDPVYHLLVANEQGIFAAISVSRDPDYNSLVVWWKIQIIIFWWEMSRGSLPPFSSAGIQIRILWCWEDPDYNLLVGKEQRIFTATSVSRDPD
jgi:hypothetical protein